MAWTSDRSDPAQLAKFIVDIATGEVEDRAPTPEERGRDPAASAMGRKVAPRGRLKMTPERRKEIASGRQRNDGLPIKGHLQFLQNLKMMSGGQRRA
jgi:hypothetical protein